MRHRLVLPLLLYGSASHQLWSYQSACCYSALSTWRMLLHIIHINRMYNLCLTTYTLTPDEMYNNISDINGALDHITNLQSLYLDHNAFTVFPNLTYAAYTILNLRFDYNHISTIDNSHLAHFHNIRSLYLTKNKLISFPYY